MSSAERDQYEAFISYRRESGAAEARLIRAELRDRNVRAFLDVDDLKSGNFDEALLRRIAGAPNFILILSPHALDRCSHKRDWLRQEIAQAVRTRRNIIPILLRGFEFPDPETLPDDLQTLGSLSGIEYSHTYFDATIKNVLRYLRTESSLEPEMMETRRAEDEPESPGPSQSDSPPAPTKDGPPSASVHSRVRALTRVNTRAGMIALAVIVFLGFAFYGLTKLKTRHLPTNSNQATNAEASGTSARTDDTTTEAPAQPKKIELSGTIWRLVSGNKVVFEPNGILHHKSANGQVVFSSGDWTQTGNVVKFDINKYIYYNLVISLDGNEMKGTQHWFHKKTIIPTRITKVQ